MRFVVSLCSVASKIKNRLDPSWPDVIIGDYTRLFPDLLSSQVTRVVQ